MVGQLFMTLGQEQHSHKREEKLASKSVTCKQRGKALSILCLQYVINFFKHMPNL